jgi:tape measure domain-containing protein
MSKTIDSKVVEMKFDNSNFEKNVSTSMSTLDKLKKSLKFEDSAKGFESISKAAGKVDMSALSEGVDSVNLKFSALQVVAVQALTRITDAAINAGSKIVKALAIDPITTGFQEYETQINATQTILANTQKEGATINDVNRALDELNKYADLTIYNFTEMTRNIGTFTAAGVDLDTSVNAIKGIANLAAVSGSTSQQASTAMYQLSQALASGTVKLMDWNSVVNAGMGGQVFQDALKTTARVHGIAIDEMITDEGSFRETLQKGWLTSDILTETLQHFTEFSDAYNEESLKRQGYNEKEIAEIKQLGTTATDAATKVKTFSQLWDVMKETAQSGWSATWKIIVGDFEEAKSTLTEFSEALNAPLEAAANARNAVLKSGFSSGWSQLLSEGIEDTEGFKEALISLGKEANPELEYLIDEAGGFAESLKSGWVTSDMLAKGIENLTAKTAGLSDEQLEELGYTREQVTELENLNEKIKAGGINLDEYAEKLGRMSGRENIIEGLRNVWLALAGDGEEILGLIGNIKEAFTDIFPPITGERLYDFTEKFKELTELIKPATFEDLILSDKDISHLYQGGEVLNNLKDTFRGVFAAVDIVGQGLKSLGSIFTHIISKLAPVGASFLDVTGSVGNFVVSIDEAIKEGKFFETFVEVVNGFIDKLSEGISSAKDYVVDLLGSIAGIDFSKFDSFGDVLSAIGEKLSEFSSKIQETYPWAGTMKETFIDAFESIRDSADGELGAANAVIEEISKLGEKIKKAFSTVAEKVKIFFAPLTNIIKRSFEDLTIQDIFSSGALVFVSKGLKTLIKSISKLIDGVSNFGKLTKGITGVLDSAKESLEAWQKDVKSEILVKIAKAVAILAASLFVISKIDSEKLGTSLAALTGLLVEVMAAMKIASKFTDSSNDALKGLAEGAQLKQIGTALLIISGAMLVLAAALKKCEGLDWEDVLPSATVMFALMAEMMTAMGLFVHNYKDSNVDVLTGNVTQIQSMAKSMVIIGAAMYVMSLSISKLGRMDQNELVQGGVAVGVLMGVSALIVNKMKQAPGDMTGVAGSLIALAAALTLLIIPIKILGKMDINELAQGGLATASMIGVLYVALESLKNTSGDLTHVAGSLIAMAAAMVLLMIPIKTFAQMNLPDLAQGLGAVIVGLGALTGALVLIDKFTTTDLSSVGPAMIEMAAAILVLSFAIEKLGNLSRSQIAAGILALASAMIILGGTAVLLEAVEKPLNSLANIFLKLGISALGIAALITALPLLGTLASELVQILLAALVALASAIEQAAPALVHSALVLIDNILIEIENYVPTIIEHLAGIVQKIGQALSQYFGEITTSDWINAAIFAGIVAASGFLVKWFASFAKQVPQALIGAAGVAAILVIVGGIIAAMTLLDVTSVLTIATSLSEVMLSLSVVIAVLGEMPLTAGLTAGLALAEFVGVMTAVIAALGGLNQIPGFSWLLDEGIEVLGKIGTGIGTFVGSIVGSAVETMSAGIAKSGKNLSNFMTNIQGFVDGAAKIKSDVLTGVKTLTAAILLLTGASFVNSLTSLLTLGNGSLPRLGSDLAAFGPAFARFASSVSDIDTDAVNASAAAISAIASVLGSVNGNPIDSIIDAFTGTSDLQKLGENLEPFGKALIGYGKAVEGIDSYQNSIESSKTAATVIIDVANMIPNSGGLLGAIVGNNDIDDFGTAVKKFGGSLMGYGKAVEGIKTYIPAINKSLKAAESLVDIAKSADELSNYKNLGTIGESLISFGGSMLAYGRAVEGIGTYVASITVSRVAASSLIGVAKSADELKGNGSRLPTFGKNICNFATKMKTAAETIASYDLSVFSDFKATLEEVLSIVESLDQSGISDLVSNVETFATAMETLSETSLDDFLDSFTNSSTAATNAINTLVSNLTSALSKKESTLKEKFKTVASNARKGLTENSVKTDFKSAGEALADKIAEGVSGKGQTVVEKFAAICSSSVNTIRNQYSSFKNAGSYLTAGFSAGINSNKNVASSTGKEIANAASGSMEHTLDEHSPSKVGYRIGDYLGVGFIDGLLNNVSTTGLAGEKVADSARSGLTSVVSQITDLIENGMDANPTITPVLDLTEVQNGVIAMSGLMSTLSGHSIDGTVNVAAKTANGMNRTAFASSGEKTAASAAQNNVTNTNNFYITGTNAKNIADEVDRVLQKKIERRKIVWA